jgi:hypothetical protein
MAKVTTEQNSQYPGATVSGIKQPFNIGLGRHGAEIAQSLLGLAIYSLLIPIRHKNHNIADSCLCEGVTPEANSAVRDCFAAPLLAKTACITRVIKIIANWY